MQKTIFSSRVSLVFVTGLVLILFAVLVRYPIYGADIYYNFYRAASHIWDGTGTLYGAGTEGIFNPAHAMLYWLAMGLLPLRVANALHMMFTLALLLGTVHIWNRYAGRSILKTVLAIATMYTVDHLVRGQMDMIAVFGLVLAFDATKQKQPYLLGAGATLAMLKPTNLVLPLLLIALAIRDWSPAAIMKAAAIPLLTIAATVLVFGFDWPLRLIAHLMSTEPFSLSVLSIWDMSDLLNLPVLIPAGIALVLIAGVIKHHTLTAQHFAFAIVANLLISTYVAGYHYVALIPAILIIRNRWYVAFCWLLSLLPVVRLISPDYGSAIALLPVFVALGLVGQMMTTPDDGKLRTTETA